MSFVSMKKTADGRLPLFHLNEAADRGIRAAQRRRNPGPIRMNSQQLLNTARCLVDTSNGLVAIVESNPTCDKRFAQLGIPQPVAARRNHRELMITTAGHGQDISGIVLYDETIRQQKEDGTSFLEVSSDAGIIAGIKVDTGAKELAGYPGENITEGLDGLRDRLGEYFQLRPALPSGAP